MKQYGKKILALLLACSVMSTNAVVLNSVVQVHAKAKAGKKKQVSKKTASPQAEGIGVEYHSIEEIQDYVKKNGAALNEKPEFDKIPAEKAPYDPGKLSDKTQQSALNMLKQIRYIAGISDQVELSEELCTCAQAGSYLNFINDELTHKPQKPEDMSDELYNLGYKGASSSNIAWQSRDGRSLNEIIALSWMEDGDDSNIDRVGHRRWLINPEMGKTGFGVAGGYSSVYAHDRSNTQASISNVVWPAQNMPTEYFNNKFPWSISTGHEVYKNDIKVSLTRLSDNKTWNFSNGSSDGDFYVNNDRYGMPGCIIFRPPASEIKQYKDGDSYKVTVIGDGETICYTVNFFDLITLNRISAKYTGKPVEEGGTIKTSDLTVTGTYSDGSTKNITDFIVEPYKINVGDNEVSIQYKDKTTTVKIPGIQGAAPKITIQFDAAGGQAVSAYTMDKGSKFTNIPTTSKDGYIFDGWYTEKTGGTKLEKNAVQDENRTYYAHWTKIELNSISAKYLWGRLIVGEVDVDREAFEVTAAYTDGSTYTVSDYTIDDHILKAGENILTIRYKGKSTEVKVPAVSVEKMGVIYIGGDKQEGVTQLDDMDFRIHVTLSNGETLTVKYPDCRVDPFVIQLGENILTAHFGEKQATFTVLGIPKQPVTEQVTITFDTQGGSSVSSRAQKKGAAIGMLPDTSKTGYIFDGWYTQAAGGTQITPETLVQQDVTYYAHWTKNSIPDTPDKPDTPQQPDTPGKPDTPQQPDTPSQPDKPEQPNTPDTPNDTNQNVTISFDAQGGIAPEALHVTKNGSLSYIPVAAKSGCEFQGWYTGRDGTGTKLTLGTVHRQDTVYYAYWTTTAKKVTGIHVAVNGNAVAGENVRKVLAVNAAYSDGTSGQIFDYTVSIQSWNAGNNSLVVTSNGFSKTIQVQASEANAGTANTVLKSISAVYSGGRVPTGIYYRFDGLTVKGVYADGSVKELNGYTLSGNMIKSGNNTVTIQYEGKTAVFSVTGYQQAIISIHTTDVQTITVAQDDSSLYSILNSSIPNRNGYQFEGWFLDKECTQNISEQSRVLDGMHVFAKWKQVGNWKLNKSKAVINKGKTMKLSIKGQKSDQIRWKTSKKKVASVSKKGVVKGKKAGKAVITAVTGDGSVLTCNVTVKKVKKKK